MDISYMYEFTRSKQLFVIQ